MTRNIHLKELSSQGVCVRLLTEDSALLTRRISLYTRVHLETPYTYFYLFLFCFFFLLHTSKKMSITLKIIFIYRVKDAKSRSNADITETKALTLKRKVLSLRSNLFFQFNFKVFFFLFQSWFAKWDISVVCSIRSSQRQEPNDDRKDTVPGYYTATESQSYVLTAS